VTRLFYVDESRDRGHHYHVGLLAEGYQVAVAEEALDAVVERAYDNGLADYDSELHALDIWNRHRGWARPPARSTPDQRGAVIEAALTVIVQNRIEVLARGVDMDRFATRYPGGDPMSWAFSNLLERLNERLHALDDYGLVIVDQHDQYREIMQRDVANAKRRRTGGYRSQQFDRIVDTAHFVDSKLSRMVQAADMAAYVLRRRATIPRENDSRLETLMGRLHSIVEYAVPDPKGQYHSIRY
jgi:Protein of unknown function (DUF3800)